MDEHGYNTDQGTTAHGLTMIVSGNKINLSAEIQAIDIENIARIRITKDGFRSTYGTKSLIGYLKLVFPKEIE